MSNRPSRRDFLKQGALVPGAAATAWWLAAAYARLLAAADGPAEARVVVDGVDLPGPVGLLVEVHLEVR